MNALRAARHSTIKIGGAKQALCHLRKEGHTLRKSAGLEATVSELRLMVAKQLTRAALAYHMTNPLAGSEV